MIDHLRDGAVRVVALRDIERVLPDIDILAEMERGFVAYSAGRVTVPPVGELLFSDPPGEMHIKYGTIDGDDVFVVKVATGFYRNAALGLPTFGGLLLVFDARTGQPRTILLDGGHLTNVRAAAAGAVAARYLAPRTVAAIGVLGSGVQARLQPEYLKTVTSCRDIVLWARDPERAASCAADLGKAGFQVRLVASPGDVARESNLIVTTTASHTPLLSRGDLRAGTHVTAMGSDSAAKRELAPELIAGADIVVADSLRQCLAMGEIHHAVEAAVLDATRVVELGDVIAKPALGRTGEQQITIADLTGVAVQDIQMAKAVSLRLDRARTGSPP